MKTYNNLFDKIVDEENIKKAIVTAAKGKRHKRVVEYALSNRDEVAYKLSIKLKEGTWRPLRIHTGKEVLDGKRRNVVCPSFINEQVVHHAIMSVCAPIFIKKFYHYTCGNIKGRGPIYAKKYIEKNIGKLKYCCKLDVRKFFPSIRPSWVFRELRKTIRDKKVLLLFSRILRSNTVCIDGNIIKKGLPIGFYTSPFFANVLMNSLDHETKEVYKVKLFVRYMDDILLCDNNKKKLKMVCSVIENRLKKFYMSLKNVPQVHKFKVIDYIGFKFYKDKTILRKSVFLKAIRNFKKFNPNVFWARKVISYSGYFKNVNCGKVFQLFIPNLKICKSIISRRAKHV